METIQFARCISTCCYKAIQHRAPLAKQNRTNAHRTSGRERHGAQEREEQTQPAGSQNKILQGPRVPALWGRFFPRPGQSYLFP